MSGHSKWSQIKRKKGATDAKRGQLFSRLSRQLTVASRVGHGLDLAVAAAKAANMPKDNIDRAIAKGHGSGAESQIESALYELYAPGGAGLLVSVLTDNKNRALGELRAVCNKLGGSMAQSGSVQFLFDRRAVIEVDTGADVGATQLAFIEAGVDDVASEDDRVIGYAAPDRYQEVVQATERQGLTVLGTRLAWVPKVLHSLDQENRDRLIRLMEDIDDLDDVESVETNAEL